MSMSHPAARWTQASGSIGHGCALCCACHACGYTGTAHGDRPCAVEVEEHEIVIEALVEALHDTLPLVACRRPTPQI